MNFFVRLLSLFIIGTAAAPAAASASPEHSLVPALGSQEPPPVEVPATEAEPKVEFETKMPVRVEIPLVYAQDVGEKAQVISFEERQRRTLLYSYAMNVINLRVLETELEFEMARRKEADVRVGGEGVDEKRVTTMVQEQVDVFLAQVPNGDFWHQRRIEGYTEDGYRRTVGLVLKIADMFFPADPELWPVDQLKVLFDSEAEGSHWDPVREEWESRLEMKRLGQSFAALPSDFVFSYIMLPGVFTYLRGLSPVVGPRLGLPEGVALRVGTRDFKTADLVEEARELLSPVAEESAAAWVSAIELVERDLRKKGHWLSKATLDAMWDAERADYDGTIFTHEQTVTEFLGYPSLELYREYFDARRSFRSTLPSSIPAEWLQEEIRDRGQFLGLGKIKCDFILIAAVDPVALEYSLSPRIYRGGADPFGTYEETAKQVAQMLKDGESFDSVLLEYSNFPPRQPGDNVLQRDRGRFGALSRADLRSLLGESDFTDFLQGYSIGDDAFFDAEEGAVYGPLRGPLGWHFYRVSRRDPATTAMDPENNPQQAYQLEDDLISQRFLAYVNSLRN